MCCPGLRRSTGECGCVLLAGLLLPLLLLLLLAAPMEKLPSSSVMVATDIVVVRRHLLGRPWVTLPSRALGGVAGGIGALRARCVVLK